MHILIEAETSGLEDLLDWSKLEEALEDGAFRTKRQFRAHVAELLAAHGRTLHTHRWQEVKAGMFPEYRDMYDALPDISPEENREAHANNLALTPEAVMEIRSEHAAGRATVTSLARRFGVGRTTVSNVVNNITWRNAA